VTARLSTPFVKVFEEERELTVMLLVDISGSSILGSTASIKRDIITEIGAVLSYSANTNNDKVGVILFSDKVEHYIPPQKGKSHILRIIRELIAIEPRPHQTTDIDACLRFFNNASKKRTITFLLSDFLSRPFEDSLKITSRKHDLVGVQIYDKLDRQLPDVGPLQVIDSESGEFRWLDTGSAEVRNQYARAFDLQQEAVRRQFNKSGAAFFPVRTDEDYVKTLKVFFMGR